MIKEHLYLYYQYAIRWHLDQRYDSITFTTAQKCEQIHTFDTTRKKGLVNNHPFQQLVFTVSQLLPEQMS